MAEVIIDVSLILTVISVGLLVPSFFGHLRGVGGGATLGLVVGIIVGVIMQDFLNALKWGFVMGSLTGFGSEILGMFGDFLKHRARLYQQNE